MSEVKTGKPFYQSKKWWSTIATAALGIAAAHGAIIPIPPELVADVVMGIFGLGASYNVGQGIADGRN